MGGKAWLLSPMMTKELQLSQKSIREKWNYIKHDYRRNNKPPAETCKSDPSRAELENKDDQILITVQSANIQIKVRLHNKRAPRKLKINNGD